ncbi:MAG: SwmB domain-containing protein [Chloroflexota bacterium]|nr:SwmB domain-containing protein [Chloroflexota bacterium]MDE2895779.1 SwmB domain-containing protein [Chloroflexota bacterium]
MACAARGRDASYRVDHTPPTVLSETMKGTALWLTFDEELGAVSWLSNDQFAVVRTPQGRSEDTIGLTGSPVVSSATVTLTLASAAVERCAARDGRDRRPAEQPPCADV